MPWRESVSIREPEVILHAMNPPIPAMGHFQTIRQLSARRQRGCWLNGARTAARLIGAAMMLGCGSAAEKSGDAIADEQATIRLFNAASITRPLRVLADSFTAQTGIKVVQESQSSLELARKLTEFNDIPDVIALADYRVFPTLLAPKYVDGWHLFARNRMVIGFTDKSRHAEQLANDGWRHVLTRRDVEIGRSDPNTDPSGYRTLMVFQLAELHYGEAGLARKLLDAAAPRNVRPREADQVGMLQAGSLDYIWTYENLAKSAGLKYVSLPSAVDLSNPADSSGYARAAVTVVGKQRGDSVSFRGEPILYGVAVPFAAPDTSRGHQFVQFMLSDAGRRIMRAAFLDALDTAVALGTADNRRNVP
jgi:molybdate/tungstate transport system substrate-binding protein